MSTIKATLEADVDGTLHLPLPPELRRGKLNVTATVEPVSGNSSEAVEDRRKQDVKETMKRIRARDPLKDIQDPSIWQREMRKDRLVPGRD